MPVKYMESDATATRHKNRICHKMIQVYNHGKHKNEVGCLPFCTKKNECYYKRRNYMHTKMHCCLNGFQNLFSVFKFLQMYGRENGWFEENIS